MSPALVLIPAVVVLLLLVLRRRPEVFVTPWGQWPDRDRDMHAIGRWFEARRATRPLITDDRTWTDLDMDSVFVVLDRTCSLVGQQALYAQLRTVSSAARSQSFQALVGRFETDAAARASAQRALSSMARVDGHDLWWLVQPGTFETARWHVVFPIVAALMLVTLALATVYPALIMLMAAVSILGAILRATAAPHLRVLAATFRQIGPLVDAAGHLRDLRLTDAAVVTTPLDADLARLGRLRRIAGWIGRPEGQAAAGDLGAIVIEYLNLVFSLDGNAVFFGARHLRAHGDALLRVLESVGDIDAALSVASYRAGTPHWTRPRLDDTTQVRFDDIRHPLIPDAVPNQLASRVPRGVVITGSNMSGKTTFLRTLGVTALLARTIETVLARDYVAPPFVVRSCIGRSDDPAHGRSYYMVEVDAVLELVAAARNHEPHLFLFDELFRGTNTVERIAAGEAVLWSLLDRHDEAGNHLVVVATHDMELVDLLEERYDAFHFGDRIGDDGLVFDYCLSPGSATTRNAIALLKHRGAPDDLVARAASRAARLSGN